ncbi:sodium-dependent lysophosphatidylcholine symporter 1 isoform X2 [Lepidochelys kempii]|uniref:sodium-dependent lysophosphatidylcholine symporter 1 isoform X2 n=1 Tax=Lepidochelys kempii TaxID=8472 RepID=UPI003C6FD4BF
MAKGKGAESASSTGLLQPGLLKQDELRHAKKESKEKLSVCNKLCYAVGGAPYQITGCALGFFLQIYLLDVAQDHLFHSICCDLLLPGMVCARHLEWPSDVVSSLLLHVPDPCDGMTVEVLGTVLGTAIQGQIVGQVDTPCIQDSRLFGVTNSSVAVEEVNITRDAGSLTDTRNAYMIAAGVIGGIYILCAVVLFLGVQEKRDTSQLQSDEPISFFQGLKLVMKHGAYIKLITGFLFTSLAFMLLEGNFALFCTYTLGFRNEFQNILLAIMLSATLTIPLWQWFLMRFGKKTAVYVGISSAIPFLIMVVVLESNLIVTYVVAIAAGISVAAAFLLPWSMLPDVIDDFNLQHPDAHGHEAIFFSFYVFFTKFTSGVSLGISTLSLDFAGYKTRGCSQPEEVKFTLKMLVSAAPVGLILLGLLLFKLYPIDEDKRRENKKALQDLREEENSSDSDSMELASIV